MGSPPVNIRLDSAILIDRFNGSPQAREYLAEIRGEAVAVVTRSEILVGFGDAASLRKAERFLDFFPLLEITKPIADLAASLRREFRWKLPDAFQAALARHHNLRLATRNTRGFPPETHEFVTVPYAL